MVDERKVQKSIQVLREAKAKFDNSVILWAGGKDSTAVVDLARKSVPEGADFPFQTVLLDTTFQFEETYNFLSRVSKKWEVPFEKTRNEKALMENVNPDDYESFECCNRLKTENLRQYILRNDVDAVIEGIRWDEHPARGKTKGEEGDFHDTGFYDRETPVSHTRVYPIQNWTERDVWNYTEENNLPTNPLYSDQYSYRSIGCWPCTEPVESEEADERSGREQDKEKVMERLRQLGYM